MNWHYAIAIVVFFLSATLLSSYVHKAPDMEPFISEYAAAPEAERESIVEKYLADHTASELLEQMEANFSSCHVLSHDIGKAVYQHTKNISEAAYECGRKCSDGCFHGALMSLFSTESDSLGGALSEEGADATSARIQEISNGICLRDDVRSFVRPWKCFHGLGHMFIFGLDDVSAAIDACSKIEGGKLAHGVCAGGVFMEVTSQEKYRADLEGKNYFPCDKFPEYALGCYIYKMSYMINAWGQTNVESACRNLKSEPEQQACFFGLGWARYAAIRDKKKVPDLCKIQDDTERKECVKGVASYIANNSFSEDQNVCAGLVDEYAKECVWAVSGVKMDFTQ